MSDVLKLRTPTNPELSHHYWVDVDLANIQDVTVNLVDYQVSTLELQPSHYKKGTIPFSSTYSQWRTREGFSSRLAQEKPNSSSRI